MKVVYLIFNILSNNYQIIFVITKSLRLITSRFKPHISNTKTLCVTLLPLKILIYVHYVNLVCVCVCVCII